MIDYNFYFSLCRIPAAGSNCHLVNQASIYRVYSLSTGSKSFVKYYEKLFYNSFGFGFFFFLKGL